MANRRHGNLRFIQRPTGRAGVDILVPILEATG
jgi:hypothetical protein